MYHLAFRLLALDGGSSCRGGLAGCASGGIHRLSAVLARADAASESLHACMQCVGI